LTEACGDAVLQNRMGLAVPLAPLFYVLAGEGLDLRAARLDARQGQRIDLDLDVRCPGNPGEVLDRQRAAVEDDGGGINAAQRFVPRSDPASRGRWRPARRAA